MGPSRLILAWACCCLLVIAAGQRFAGCPDDLCPEGACNCTCDGSNRDYELQCPGGLPSSHPALLVSVHGSQGGVVEIKCTSSDSSSDYDLLKNLNLGPRSNFVVKLCPLPDVPFRQLMADTNMTRVMSLNVQSFANYSHHLTRNHLSGLGELTKLALTNNMLTEVPEDLFADAGNLTWLNLRDNLLRLPKNIFRPVSKLDVLELGSNNLTYLEPGIFRNLTRLRLLNLWGNRLKNLTRSLFSDLTNLESLDLNSNHLATLPPDIFSDLQKLKKINLHGNSFMALPQGLFSSNTLLEGFTLNHNRVELRVIPPGLLSNLPNLHDVGMHHCNISSLPEDFLWGSPALTTLILNWNSIATLPAKIFKDNQKLLDVDFSHNKISTVPDDLFAFQKELVKLNLAYNNLQSISDSFFTGLESLTTLDLSHNQIALVAHQPFPRSLITVDLSFNEITDLTYFDDPSADSFGTSSVFQSSVHLQTLLLSHNRLTRIGYSDWHNTLVKLKNIDLSYNNLSYVNGDDFDFSSGPTINLSFNNISVVDLNELESIAQFKFEGLPTTQMENRSSRVTLKGNPLICDCQAFSLMRLLREDMRPEVNYIVTVDSMDLICHEPLILHSKLVKDVDPDMVNCVWDRFEHGTKCPDKCECRFRPHSSSLIIDCHGRNLTTWPAVLPTPSNANHTELYLYSNQLSTVPETLHFSYTNVTHLYLAYNRLQSLNLSHFSPNISVIELNNNNFSTLGRSLKTLQELKSLKMIALNNNPWKCDCSARDFLHFVQSHYRRVYHYLNVSCSDGQRLANLTTSDLCPISGTAIGIGSVIIALIGLLIGGLFALYYRYQKEIKVWLYAHRMCLWFVTEDELDKDKKYDAFISYSHQDEAFVVNELVRVLEGNTPKYKLCLHYRDWIVGDFIPNQIARSVEDSRRTVVVLSPSFIESVWGRMEFRTAHSQALSEKRARVIIILFGEIGDTESLDPELKAYLAMNTYVKWGDPWFWDKLLYALPHPPEITKGIPSLCRRRREPNHEKQVIASPENGATTPPVMNTMNHQTSPFIEPLKTLSNTKPI
uniref:Protein toll n=1 Tax=Lygus hesperus TaxID=30085 RepID=A0A0A9XC66_LYGHE